MKTDVGEYIVGAYLKIELGCDVVDYNVRHPGGGIKGLNELDVVGYDFSSGRVFLCEVTTHIKGLQIGRGNAETIKKIEEKHANQRAFAEALPGSFSEVRFQFWSPYVPEGYLTNALAKIDGLELFINGQYKAAVQALMAKARKQKHDSMNPFFRTLQIIAALRD